MKSTLLMTATALVATSYLCSVQAENLSDTNGTQLSTKILHLAQEKGGNPGGMSGAPSAPASGAVPEGKGGERAPDKGAQKNMEKGSSEKLPERGASEKSPEKGEKAARDTRDDNRKKEERAGEKSDRSREKSGEKSTNDREKGDRNATSKDTKEKSSAQNQSKGDAKSVRLNSQQQTKVRTVIRSQNVKHLRRADIKVSIRVGVRIPTSVQYYPVPVEIIEVVPEYRGYYYIIVDDDILIIAPETREIVYIIHT